MAIKQAVQSVQTSIPRCIHNKANEMAKNADVDVGLIYSAAIMAIEQWSRTDVVNYTTQAKIAVLDADDKLPPAPTRKKPAEAA